MQRLFLILALIIGVAFSAYAAEPVVTQPYNATSTITNNTIAVTNTFQKIWNASTATTGRVGCLVQNNGTHTMYVFFGATTSATTQASVQLQAGQSLNCNVGVIVVRNEIAITGTAGDSYYGAEQ